MSVSGQTNHRDRVVAVISSFQPSHELVQHCAELAPQVAQIIVVDDGSDSRADSVLKKLTAAGVTVERLGDNRGIGAAMNSGFERAREFDREFVVTFDQDSSVPAGFVDALVDEFDRLVHAGVRVGMVAPEFFSTTPQTRTAQTREYLEAYSPIQSGLLMLLRVIDDLGPQRADYFIDLVDSEYYFRAHRAGYSAACAPGLILPHGFGHRLYVHALGRRLHKADGRPRMVAVSTPFRYYYRARNRVVMNREFAKLADVRKQLHRDTRADILLDFGVALYSAKGKFALLRLMIAGWRDGLRGRLGKMPERAAQLSRRVSWRHPVADEKY
jgi:rhamnosyltransferase